MAHDLTVALLEHEIDLLDAFLAELDGPVNSFEALDGMFCALICVPTMVMPSEYTEVILGNSAFADMDQTKQINVLMGRHWNTVIKTLGQASKTGDVYVPALLVDEEGNPMGNEWAEGFLLGMSFNPEQWDEFSQIQGVGELLIPTMVFAHEHHPDPTFRSPPMSKDAREDLLDEMFDNLMSIYEYFHLKTRDMN